MAGGLEEGPRLQEVYGVLVPRALVAVIVILKDVFNVLYKVLEILKEALEFLEQAMEVIVCY